MRREQRVHENKKKIAWKRADIPMKAKWSQLKKKGHVTLRVCKHWQIECELIDMHG